MSEVQSILLWRSVGLDGSNERPVSTTRWVMMMVMQPNRAGKQASQP